MSIEEIKSTCRQCGRVWFYGKREFNESKNAHDMERGVRRYCCGGCMKVAFNPTTLPELDKCPNCGSRDVSTETVRHETNE